MRYAKYEYEDGLQGAMSNDYVIYRYADVLTMEGEPLVHIGKTVQSYFAARTGIYRLKKI